MYAIGPDSFRLLFKNERFDLHGLNISHMQSR